MGCGRLGSCKQGQLQSVAEGLKLLRSLPTFPIHPGVVIHFHLTYMTSLEMGRGLDRHLFRSGRNGSQEWVPPAEISGVRYAFKPNSNTLRIENARRATQSIRMVSEPHRHTPAPTPKSPELLPTRCEASSANQRRRLRPREVSPSPASPTISSPSVFPSCSPGNGHACAALSSQRGRRFCHRCHRQRAGFHCESGGRALLAHEGWRTPGMEQSRASGP